MEKRNSTGHKYVYVERFYWGCHKLGKQPICFFFFILISCNVPHIVMTTVVTKVDPFAPYFPVVLYTGKKGLWYAF